MKNSLQMRKSNLRHFKGVEECSLKFAEKKLLKKVIGQIFKGSLEIESSEHNRLHRIISKLSFNGVVEGSILALILNIKL